jgi:F-type H+-transporting ATPase subunit delta
MDKLICNKYAQALFELAREQDKCQALEETALQLRAAIDDNPEFAKLLGHPDIAGEDKLKVISSAFTDLDKDLEGFISLVFVRGRGNMIAEILDSFTELSRQYRNVATADIVSAVSLTDSQLDRLVAVLEKKLGKTIEPRVRVDSTLLGGLKITVCGHTINSTVKSRLDELKALLENSNMSQERRDAV